MCWMDWRSWGHSILAEVKNSHDCLLRQFDAAIVWCIGSGRHLDLGRRRNDSAMVAIDIDAKQWCRLSSSPLVAHSIALLKQTLQAAALAAS